MLTHTLTTCSRGKGNDEDEEDTNKGQVETTSGWPRRPSWHRCSHGLASCNQMADLAIQDSVPKLTITSGEHDQQKDIGNEKSLVGQVR